ncbi:disease resistance protein RUN1-like [Macadamia integrifolia]|uniref:disease resistance protein RUN1-like n=1 Tax=Macadamia integrifolia TaxID=60698 RepID=UPI001C5310A4|nr:disease resistance protein RUN1-like [Macadamia integrifolia]
MSRKPSTSPMADDQPRGSGFPVKSLLLGSSLILILLRVNLETRTAPQFYWYSYSSRIYKKAPLIISATPNYCNCSFMAQQIEASSYSFSSGSSNFDVFLNFRGEDLRKNFISFLHKALKNRGINDFIDSENLCIGEAIGPDLLKAIKGSKISIPVFSKGYASSKWCLLELSHILDCHKSKRQVVLPIFFDVEPSHVRNQSGSFEGPFREHEKNFESKTVESWREALRVVGNLKGWVLHEDVNGDQAELVELVVKRVSGELINSTHLAECNYPVGIDSHINGLLSLLNIGSDDVHFVGICGFGGIGKTTIAKEVYNRLLLSYNRHSFLFDVREQATQWMGLVSLQKRILKDIFKTDIDIGDYHTGKRLIKQYLCKEKVLVVLDDVDSQEQVDALAGALSWFGQGSRVIITTRDEHILNLAKVDKDRIYRPQELDCKQSLQLFSLHAFSTDQPHEDYMQISHDVVRYSGGLPLTLEVVGSYLLDIRSKEEWESTLQKLKEIPLEKIKRRLKISYDNLDDYQKAIFLDAACFFIGWPKETVFSIWEACGYHPKSSVHRIIKRSLLKFGDYGECPLKMHDQIRDMGRNIVREESPTEPGKRSRLWFYGDILDVFDENKGTDMIKGMILPYDLPSVYLANEYFKMIPNLRFLEIKSEKFIGDFSELPSALRWFRWDDCPWDILPTNFYHKRLVHLDLSWNIMIEQAWHIGPQDKNKRFQNLKVLDLSHCRYLSKSPDFSWFPFLERLDFGYCKSLVKLDKSIGKLSQLKSLIVKFCYLLKMLPDDVGLLEKLEVLDAKNCRELEKLPRSMGRMRCLRSINLTGTRINSISKLPGDFSMLRNLVQLEMSYWDWERPPLRRSPRIWNLLLENGEPDQQKPSQHSSDMVVANSSIGYMWTTEQNTKKRRCINAEEQHRKRSETESSFFSIFSFTPLPLLASSPMEPNKCISLAPPSPLFSLSSQAEFERSNSAHIERKSEC